MTCWLAIIIALRACRDCAGRGWIRTTWRGGQDIFTFRVVEALAICATCGGDARQEWAHGGLWPWKGLNRHRPVIRRDQLGPAA